MPTICSRLSFASAVNSGISSWQGTHQDAQTLTTLTLRLKFAGSSPGTCAPLLSKPCSGGNEVCGAGRPIRAEGNPRGIAIAEPRPEQRGQREKDDQRQHHQP